ncbi:MAG: TCP-1/cpn60 chaperonin family protein [Armatimonadota bacterium]|nr:TCP-1/cpn60 chaperonin family protein [Armatimonadota bacterium]
MSTSVRQVTKSSEVDERTAALVANASAIAALASAIEGTLGPKGLDCMLVDRFGDTTVTNDGATILDRIDTNHPAARMLIKTARAQEEAVGDGTTTTTILASAIINEGAAQAARGVPVVKIIEGVRKGVAKALEFIESHAQPVDGVHDDLLLQVASIAARGHEDIANLIVQAARLVGADTLRDPGFSLADTVTAKEGAENEVFCGVVLDKQRVSRQMPRSVEDAKVLVVDDALEPLQIDDDALGTESGFAKHLAYQEEFRRNIRKLIDMGIRFVAAAKGIDPAAEELFTDAGIFAVRRLGSKDISRLAELTGARTIKRSGLSKPPEELERFLGRCERVYEDERLDQIRVIGKPDSRAAAVIVGASTREVRDERERIARDAAGAVQAAVKSGVVPGGGAVEIAASRYVQQYRESVTGMAAYGVEAVASALRRPLAQIAANAGFNPLEKVEEVVLAQAQTGKWSLAVDCDSGAVADMLELGVVDPAGVKLYAIRAAAELAEAILRINTVIRKRDESSEQPSPRTGEGHEEVTGEKR